MSRIVNSLEGLDLKSPIFAGSCSKIYKVANDEYFKLLNEDYRDLHEPENKEVLETLIELQQISDAPSLALPITIYCSEDNLFGYTSKIMPGLSLDDLPEDTSISLISHALETIKPEVRELSKHGIKTEDIGGDNILFSDHMSLIDLELSLVSKDASSDYLYTRTMNQILNSTISATVGSKVEESISTSTMFSFKNALKTGESDNFEQFFDLVIHELEVSSGKTIKTLGESKTAFQKVKK